MTDVFVSYASQDRDRVRPLVEAIEAMGWDVWWDREIGAGVAFDREIEKAIDEAECIVVAWTALSVESEWVRNEATEGLERGILVPVAIEDVRLPLAFRRTQTIKLFEGDAERASLMEAIARFVPLDTAEEGGGTPYVGRQGELASLLERAQQACDGRGATVLISGEAGVGKTRLTTEFTERAKKLGLVVLRGHSLDMEGAPPYQPVIEQLEYAARIVPPENLRAALGENAPEVAKLMPNLRQLFPDIPEATQIAPEQQRQYLLHGFSEFISRAGEVRPMVLVFEDLHWADESTCVLLRHLASRIDQAKVMIVGTYRDQELEAGSPFSRALRDLIRERLAEEMPLERLNRDEVRELVTALARHAPPEELVDLVYSETEGNAFFVEEVYRHLDDSGALFEAPGQFRAGIQIADSDVPRGVRLVIEERLQRISEDCRSALTAGAVIGRNFAFDVLVNAARLDEDATLDAIEEAVDANLIEDVSRSREARYRFVHEQFRQTLLNGLSFPRRQRLHLRIADALEQAQASGAAENAGELAYHLFQAGAAADPERTVHYLTLSGDRALEALAFEDALRAFDMALEVLDEANSPEQARLHAKRALALRGAARVEDSLAVLAQAIELCADPATRDDLLLQRARLLVDLYRGAEALSDLETLLEHARANADGARELEAQVLLADAHYSVSLDQPGTAGTALESAERAVELARQAGDPHALGQSLLSTTHFVDYYVDYRPKASANLAEAYAIAQTLGDEDLYNDVLTMGLRLRTFIPVGFEVDAENVLKRLEARREPIALKEHLFWMIVPKRDEGELERSVEIADAAIALADRLGVPPVQYPTFKSFALMDMGRFDEALASIEQEVSDLPAHRFGAALKEYGRVLYLGALGAKAAAERAAALIPEATALDRTWINKGLIGVIALAAARHDRDPAIMALLEKAQADVGARPGALERAALAIAEGDAEAALTAADRRSAQAAETGQHGVELRAEEIGLQALAALERWTEVASRAAEVAAEADARRYRIVAWRAHAHRAVALERLGRTEDAAAERTAARALLETIAANIADAALREGYLADPLATAVLA